MREEGSNKEGQKRQRQGVMDSGHTRKKLKKDKEGQRNKGQRVSQRVRDKTHSFYSTEK